MRRIDRFLSDLLERTPFWLLALITVLCFIALGFLNRVG